MRADVVCDAIQAEEKKKFELKAQIVQYLHCKMELEKAKQLE